MCIERDIHHVTVSEELVTCSQAHVVQVPPGLFTAHISWARTSQVVPLYYKGARTVEFPIEGEEDQIMVSISKIYTSLLTPFQWGAGRC